MDKSNWYWSPIQTKMYYKSSQTVINGGTMILKNLKDKVLENEGLDENEANFFTVMGYKLTENMLAKSFINEKKRCCKSNSECIKEINDKEMSKLVNTCKKETKNDYYYEIKKSTPRNSRENMI